MDEYSRNYENQGSEIIATRLYKLFTKSYLPEIAIESWRECMKTRNWEADLEGDIFDEFAVKLNWNGDASIEPILSHDPGLSELQIIEPTVFRKRLKFFHGDSHSQIYKRKDKKKPGLILFNFHNAPSINIPLPKFIETTTSYRICGYYWGLPYVFVSLYIDNQGNGLSVLNPRRGQKLLDVREYGRYQIGNKKEVNLKVPNNLTPGAHTIDLYVFYPGDNPGGVEMKLVRDEGSTSTLMDTWKLEHISGGTDLNFGNPILEPLYRHSFRFSVD